jgi:hypothetical protein
MRRSSLPDRKPGLTEALPPAGEGVKAEAVPVVSGQYTGTGTLDKVASANIKTVDWWGSTVKP